MLSLAPDDMPGNTGTPVRDAAIALSIAATRSGGRAEAAVAAEPAVTSANVISGSAASRSSSAMISDRGWPGKIRQLMLALARCGRAFRAWPPWIMVTTQVVPMVPTVEGLARRVAIAAWSSGLAAKARMASAVFGSRYLDA